MTACTFRFVQRPVKWGNYRVSYTYSKALDDVSEFFFSAPINNFNIWQDYGRSDDDQRSRLAFEGTIHSRSEKPTRWERFSHGFEFTTSLTGLLSAAVQYHDGEQHDSGHGGAAHDQRSVHQSQPRARATAS